MPAILPIIAVLIGGRGVALQPLNSAALALAALLLDRWGALGLSPAPIGAGRLAGVVLVITGAILVRRD